MVLDILERVSGSGVGNLCLTQKQGGHEGLEGRWCLEKRKWAERMAFQVGEGMAKVDSGCRTPGSDR